jgi:hypothetical protein
MGIGDQRSIEAVLQESIQEETKRNENVLHKCSYLDNNRDRVIEFLRMDVAIIKMY